MPRIAVNYQKTVIYKIVCNDLSITELYVGSTTDFTKRKNSHKSSSKHKDLKIYTIIRANGNWENWTMIEIEKFPCADGNEAKSRERYWYETLNATLNTLRPIEYVEENKERKAKYGAEYYESNKETVLAQCKEYRQNNKETIKKQRAEWYDANKETVSAQRAEYYQLNKDKINQRRNKNI